MILKSLSVNSRSAAIEWHETDESLTRWSDPTIGLCPAKTSRLCSSRCRRKSATSLIVTLDVDNNAIRLVREQ